MSRSARRPSWLQLARKWMRRHQSAVWAASLLLVVLLVLGCGNTLWWVKQQTAAETEVGIALHEAEERLGEEKWSETLSLVRHTQTILRNLGSGAELRKRGDQLSKDAEMAKRLEETRLRIPEVKDDHFDHEAWATAYAAAFAWYGLDLEREDTVSAAEYIRSRSISRQLVSALEHWAQSRRWMGGQQWKHLLAVARAADGDKGRNLLRDAWERGDGKTMNGLLTSTEVDKLSPATVVMANSSLLKDVSRDLVVALLRRAQQRHPADLWINYELAVLLWKAPQPQMDEAIRHFMIVVALRPQSPGAHLNLGVILQEKGLLDAAFAEAREAIRLNPNFAEGHNNLGFILYDQGRLDEAIDEFRKAIRLKKDLVTVHDNLGTALREKGQLDEAIDECREAIRLKKDFANAHNTLAVALQYKGRLDEAIAEYREAIHLKPDSSYTHWNVGLLLLKQGRFRQAAEELRRSHELDSRQPGRRDLPESVTALRDAAERMAALEHRLPALLKRQEQPKDASERIALAVTCLLHKKFFVASARWYSEAFAEEPQLSADLNAQHRCNAACAAALASCGQGKDADKIDANERARLRQQALDWLRADLKVCRQRMDKSAAKDRPMIAQLMQHWLQDSDFAGVRGENALAKLPEAERAAWRKLWADVADMLAKAQGKAPAEKKPDTK